MNYFHDDDDRGPASRPGPERHDQILAQPFSGWTHEQMTKSIDAFIHESELEDYEDYIRRGAFLAQSKAAFDRERADGLKLKSTEERYLKLENSTKSMDKFKQPWRLYALVGCCSLGAAVQGWDETAVNGGESRA